MSDVNIQTFSGKVNVSNNFTVGSGHLFVDTQNNKVGLNTNTPDANLHVTGNTYISTDISVGGTLTMGTVTVEALHSLDAVTSVGNTTPHTVEFQNTDTSLVASGNVEANYFIGNGSELSNISLQQVTEAGNTTSNTLLLTNTDTSLIASGNVEIAGNLSVSSGITGVASSATQLQTPRNISLSGDVSGFASFDGSADVVISTTVSSSGGGFDETADPVAIGTGAGFSAQNNFSVAIGYQSSYLSQGSNSVAIGYLSGYNAQNEYSVAVGARAGEQSQGYESIAVGLQAGYTNQGNYDVALGKSAGFNGQGDYCIAIGNQAGLYGQNNYAIAIGKYAGGQYQGDYSIAIGANAGATNQHDNTIVLNATGSTFNTTNSNATYIDPIRAVSINGKLLGYDASTAEVIEHTGFTVTSTGDFTASGNVTAYSDKRLKSDIQRIESALDKVCNLTGYTFTMNNKRATGLIAQEVLEVLPEAVMGSEENHYSLAYGNMAGLLVEAIKEISSEIKTLKQKIG